MSQDQIRNILQKAKTIAIVGISKDPLKHSFEVGYYLKKEGYKIIPVNPLISGVLGEKSFRSLLDIPVELQRTIDVVDIFRKPEDVPPIVEQAIQLKLKFGRPSIVWMQLGIISERAAEAAIRAGLIVIMNKCIMVEHLKPT
jgi:predicted CoA-binding protein